MAKFRYIGDPNEKPDPKRPEVTPSGVCAKGEVVFNETDAVGRAIKIVMPKGEAVEVPDRLAKKLANNNHFEAVGASEPKAEKAAGKKGK